ncbi:MAG: hypothetical protein U0132_24285, partial [Gemmatimonadaceae bacterium]
MFGLSRALLMLVAALVVVTPDDTVAQSPRAVEVGTARGVAGAKVRGALNPIEEADGTPLSLPVVVVTGTRPGPLVWVQALTHGDEFGGARALQQVLAALDPNEMSGTVVAAMVANTA